MAIVYATFPAAAPAFVGGTSGVVPARQWRASVHGLVTSGQATLSSLRRGQGFFSGIAYLPVTSWTRAFLALGPDPLRTG